MTIPFFLIGSERSGSTMLRLMLDHHPQLACNLESDFLVSEVGDDGALPNVAKYQDFLTRDRVFGHSRFAVDETLDYRDLVNNFLTQKRIRDGKQLVGATVHHHFHRLPLLWPEAKFVYLLRDGRDVANSAVGMGWAGNAYCGADIWIDAEVRWAEMRKKLAADAFVEVRFEELVNDPVGVLTRVCAFLGVPYSNAMLSYPKKTSYRPPDSRLASQWRQRMDPRMQAFVEARIGEQLSQRGYPLGSAAPGRVAPHHDLWLRLDSKIGCFRERIARYGLALTVEEFLARRFGLRRWQANAQLRFDAIIDQGLK